MRSVNHRGLSGATMIQLHPFLSVCPLRSRLQSVFLAGSSLSYLGSEASSADSGPNFINYKPICCWQPLWRGVYPVLASVQQKHSEGWRDGGRRTQGHLRLPPWVRHGAMQGNRWGWKRWLVGFLKKFMFPTSMLKAETQDGFSEMERVCRCEPTVWEEDDNSSSIWDEVNRPWPVPRFHFLQPITSPHLELFCSCFVSCFAAEIFKVSCPNCGTSPHNASSGLQHPLFYLQTETKREEKKKNKQTGCWFILTRTAHMCIQSAKACYQSGSCLLPNHS